MRVVDYTNVKRPSRNLHLKVNNKNTQILGEMEGCSPYIL